MRKLSRRLAVVALLFSTLFASIRATTAADFKREVIYQIITDRFFDGSSSNNNPSQSAGLYDSTKTNWRAYWGGDLAGIQQKMSYLAGMGVTAIWISPPVDNLNTNIPDGSGNPTASYHGYQGRDFKRIEEHSADINNGWTTFDAFVAAAHAAGIKVIVDFAPNHSTQDNAGEFGALYDNGTFLGNYTNDTNGYFHHNGNIQNWDDRYQVQYYTLFNLADINQSNPTMDAYMKNAAKLFMDHGVDGFRVDAIKHITWGWQYSLSNTIYTHGDSFLFGEWYQSGTGDPLYRDSYKYANKSGISMLDFPLNTAIRNVFGSNANFSEIENVLVAEAGHFTWDEDLVTFIDNHDMTRFPTVNSSQTRLHQALAFILTQRGIPCIYYGTEQYLVDNTSGGGDPYNRPMMNSWNTNTTAYTLTSRLSTLRRNNTAVPYGSHQQRWINNDVYIYERKFYGNVVLVAINKGASAANITGLNTSLPAGAYNDYLTGLLSGVNINVTTATVNSWSATKIVATVPSVTNGNYQVTVTNSSNQVSNGIQFTVLAAKLIPVTFTVYNASPTQVGDYIFLTGNTVELGNWATTFDNAIGPMLTPNYPNWFINASVP